MSTEVAQDASDELPLDENFVEQAEYIPEKAFLTLSAEHPDEDSIVRRLSVGGAKLLVGPRGCGKSTLMLKAYYSLLRSDKPVTLPVYVNFKLSLQLEPLYATTPNAAFWFRTWLNLKVYRAALESVEASSRYSLPAHLLRIPEVEALLMSIEAGKVGSDSSSQSFTTDDLAAALRSILELNDLTRCVLLLDDAAHAFSARQQEDFFEFFRQIKSREISPKAAIYPGITTHSPTFHVGHDAEQIDAWVRPDRQDYVGFMRTLAEKRFGEALPKTFSGNPETLEFLSFAAFGIPRSFLNMLRSVYHEEINTDRSVDRRKLLDVARQGRELSHNVYDSLTYKLPSYRVFVETGQNVYQRMIASLKEYNKDRGELDQALEIGIRRPAPQEVEKVLGFLQYAGLLMPVGENSRGVKGVFDLYMLHFGDLITENAIIGRRTKSLSSFVAAFKAQTHQAWPRISPDTLARPERFGTLFRLSLPHCQNCGAERASENARFCQNCGSQLKTASLYDDLVNQDIAVLPLSARMIKRIKENSSIRKVRDILIDSDRATLRGIRFIGPVRATHIAHCAEEHVA